MAIGWLEPQSVSVLCLSRRVLVFYVDISVRVCLCCSALMELLSAGLVDLVFANEDEASALLDVLAAGGSSDAAAGGSMGRHQQLFTL